MCRPRQELSNEYLLAKIGFDTAEFDDSSGIPASQPAENEPGYGYRISILSVFLIFGPAVGVLSAELESPAAVR